jgi:hypothetical protein
MASHANVTGERQLESASHARAVVDRHDHRLRAELDGSQCPLPIFDHVKLRLPGRVG